MCSNICSSVKTCCESEYTLGVAKVVSRVSGLALFIIACMGAAGKFMNPALGWSVVGLSSGSLVAVMYSTAKDNTRNINERQKRCSLIMLALVGSILITLGALGGVGLLSGKQVGAGVLGTIGGLAGIVILGACAVTCSALASKRRS